MTRERRIDAALAVATLCVAVVALRRAGSPFDLPSAIVGALGTLAFEYAASRHQESIRALWAQPAVKGLTVVGTLAVVVGSVRGRSGTLPSVICGALVCYLVLLAGVATGKVAHPTEW